MIRPANIPEEFAQTESIRIVREMIELSSSMHRPIHIIGRPGTGKSTALWHIANAMKGRYCEISQASKTPKGLLELLIKTARNWGPHSQRTPISMLSGEVYSYYEPREVLDENGKWVWTPRLLVVDEVQTLEAPAFRELLRVQEKCDLTLLVAGNAQRLASTRKKDKDAETWEQIESRILKSVHLPGPGSNDCELIGATYNVEGKDAYTLLTAYGAATNFRALADLLEVARRLTGDATGIRRQHLEAALQVIEPKPAIMKLLKL